MFIKSELIKIPPCKLPKLTGRKENMIFAASAEIHKLTRSGKVLVVDYYNSTDKKLQVRFFANKKDNKFISYIVNEDKWTTKATCSILRDLGLGYDKSIYFKISTHKLVSNYFNIFSSHFIHQNTWDHYNGVLGTCELFCQAIRDNINEQKRLSKFERQKYLHSLFPKDMPKDAKEFAHKHAFTENYIFFSKLDKKRRRRGMCSCCGKKFFVAANVQHKAKTECPRCHCKATYHAQRYATSIKNKSSLWIVNKHKNDNLYEFVNVQRGFTVDGKPIINFDEELRCIYDSKRDRYLYSVISGGPYYWGPHWTIFKIGKPYQEREGVVYSNNLKEIFGDDYHNINLQSVLSNNTKLNIVNFIENIKTHPVYEYFCKSGLVYFASIIDHHLLNLNGRSFTEVLGVSKQYLPMYRDMNINADEHFLIANSKEFVKPEYIEELREIGFYRSHYDRIATCLSYMTFRQFFNYFKKQQDVYRSKNKDITKYELLNSPLIHISDYININEELDVTLSKHNLFPKDIKEAHDLLLKRVEPLRKEKARQASKEALQLVNEFFNGYEKDGLTVLVPHTRQDFIKEGQELSHCVGAKSYYDNHIAGTRMIFFIRQTANVEKAYYTAEIDMKDFIVLQLYGYGNRIAPPDVKKFTKEFAKWLMNAKTNLKKAG